MKTMMKKAEMGMMQNKPTPGSINGKRGLPLDKKIQEGIKSGKLNKDGTTKNPFPKKKMGGSMKKAEDGTKFGMASVNAGYDNNSDATAADRIVLAKKNAGKAKSGAMMKNGGAMKKAMMGTGMHKMPDGSMMGNSMMKKGGSLKKKMQYGGKAASMVPMKKGGMMKKAMMGSSMIADPMMKKGGSMKKCKSGCK